MCPASGLSRWQLWRFQVLGERIRMRLAAEPIDALVVRAGGSMDGSCGRCPALWPKGPHELPPVYLG